jgi:catabolite regulation protein CreA
MLAMVALVLASASSARAADEPDLIFRRSTVFKLLSPNDKLATYGVDDPEVDGVACHFTVPEKGGIKGWLGLAEQVSDISLACSQIGPIHFKDKMEQGGDMFRQRRSLFFKKMQIVRRLRFQAERAGLHGLFRQADRRIAEELYFFGSGHAMGFRRRRRREMRRLRPVTATQGKAAL